MSEWIQGVVVDNHHWNDHLHSLKIKPAEAVSFRAGQYARIALDIDGVKVARPYSFVNPPEDNIHEFFFNTVPDGPLSNRLAELKKGDHLAVSNRAAGFLTLSEVPPADNLWMLATGTAIGPFLSLLRTDEIWKRYPRIVLAYAVRYKKDLSYQSVLNEITAKHLDAFDWLPFVSRELDAGSMRGHIQEAIKDGSLERSFALTLDEDHSQVMICGNPEMVKDTMRVLNDRGLKKNLRHAPGHISVERYW